MKEKRYWLLLFLISFSISAQIKGIVVDEKNQPISYVNIWVENENLGTTSEENGSFSITVDDQNKVLVFSALGFGTKKVKVSEAEKVVLKEVAFQLDEIAVFSKKGKFEIEIGNYRKGGINHYFGVTNVPRIVAKYFPMTEEIEKKPFLKELTIMTVCDFLDEAKFNLHFFTVNEDGSPGNDILDENIVLKVKKGRKNSTINLEEYNIVFPKKGLFIAIEWLIIDENKFDFKIIDSKTQKKNQMVCFEPSLGMVPSENPTTWEFSKGKWLNWMWKYTNSKSEKFKDKYPEPAIKLMLTN